MPEAHLAIATCDRFPILTPDDARLLTALESRSVAAAPVVWNDSSIEWSDFDACLLRSPWDYHEQHREFLEWIKEISVAMPLWNPVELVEWNLEKTYLRELREGGVPTIPTEWVERGSGAQLAPLLAAREWGDCVIKPTVDLGAFNLRRLEAGEPGGQDALDDILKRHGAMIQPFLPSIEAEGELSLIYIDGRFSHAVRKRPALGDFRVQPIWGGSWGLTEPDPQDLRLAEEALGQIAVSPLYARVDLVEGPNRQRWLIEFELIDPNLFLDQYPQAVETLADAVVARLR